MKQHRHRVRGRGMFQNQHLGKSPSETREECGSRHECETGETEGDFAEDHHYFARGHYGDYQGESEGGFFEAEEECEQKNEDKGGRFTRRHERER